MFWEYLSQGGHEHWGELSKGGVVQGRIKVISLKVLLGNVVNKLLVN